VNAAQAKPPRGERKRRLPALSFRRRELSIARAAMGRLWAEAEALWIQSADNPSGADAYEQELSCGR